MKRLTLKTGVLSAGLLVAAALFSPQLHAAEATADAVNAYAIDNFFLFICAVLVLFMQAGFALVETGLNAAKNTVNILFKNLMDLSIGAILFYFIGYASCIPVELLKADGLDSEASESEARHPKLAPAFSTLPLISFSR